MSLHSCLPQSKAFHVVQSPQILQTRDLTLLPLCCAHALTHMFYFSSKIEIDPCVCAIWLLLLTEWKLTGLFPLGGEIDDRRRECLWFIYKVCTQNLVSLNTTETNSRHFTYSEFPSLLLVQSVFAAQPHCFDVSPHRTASPATVP